MKKALLHSSCVVLFLLIILEAQATTFSYGQPPDTNQLGVALTSSAAYPTFDIPESRVWDNFILPSNSNIIQVDWWGFNQFPATSTPSFSFAFYTDVNGAAIYQTSGSISVVGSLDVPGVPGALVYNYSFALDTPFPVEAYTTYWLSIFGESAELQWGWQLAADPTRVGAWQDAGWGEKSQVSDVAFRIVGETNSVPVPDGDCGSLALLGSGVVSLWIISKLKRRSHLV